MPMYALLSDIRNDLKKKNNKNSNNNQSELSEKSFKNPSSASHLFAVPVSAAMPSAASTAAPATIDLCCSSGVSDPEEEEQVGAKTTTTARTGTETGTGVDVVPARLSTPDWMGNLPSWARARPLSRLAIPGSHNSFTYSIDKDSPLGPDHSPRLVNFANRCSWLTKPVIYRWAVCQKISVTGQLELGVRYFDLRLCKEYFKLMEDIRKEEVERMNSKRKRKRWRKRWKGTSKLERAAISRSTPDASALRTHAAEGRSRTEICVLHALFGCDIECALTEINTFLAKHPREVVILDFQHVYGFQMTNDHFLTKMIIQLFKEKMYPRCDSHPASLEYLNDHGYQVIISVVGGEWGGEGGLFHAGEEGVIWQYCKFQVIAVNSVGAKHSKLFWPRRMFRNPWADTTDLEVLFNFLNDRLEERDLDSFFVSQAILTPRPRTVILHPFCNLENCLAR